MSIKLTIKQRKWIKEYIKKGNATRAALKVYDTEDYNTAAQIGSQNLKKLQFTDLMEEMGLSDATLLNVGVEGMTKANKIHGTGDNFVEIPDYAIRHRYWETLLKLKGKLSDKNITAAQVNVKPILGGITETLNVQTNSSDKKDSDT